MFRFSAFIILTLILSTPVVKAEVYKRSVEFEWEPIEGAKTYELELHVKDKVLKFKTESALWTGLLIPGTYSMKIRAKDQRGAPGAWSPDEEVKVGLDSPKLLSPKPQQQIATDNAEKFETKFAWGKVGGAEKYIFELSSQDGTVNKKETLEDTTFSLSLPVSKNYSWKVKAIGMGLESDAAAIDQFIILGKKISSPKIEKPENEFVREIKWQRPEYADSYAYSLQRYDSKSKSWTALKGSKEFKENEIKLDPTWPGGKYRFLIKANGPLRASSERSDIEFMVKNGNRSPAAEEIATLRESIDRLSGWYGIASYLVTIIDYRGNNPNKFNGTLQYSAVGGTGRLGVGYLSSTSPWGFLTIADLSGIDVEGSGNFTFASLEANGIFRKILGERGELRQQLGISYKELPETIGKNSSSISSTNLIKMIGPHYGIEYWYAMTPRLGFQFNAHAYTNIIKVKTPNDEALSPTVSAQVGLLGSYRFKKNITGLVGYAFKHDQAEYKATNGVGFATNNDVNSVQIEGHYLNLFLEWAL